MLNLSIESCTRHNENAVFRRPPFRATLQAQDARQIEVLVSHAGVFNTAEIAMARALAEEALGAPDGAGYHFLMAGGEAHLEGYACYGPIRGTQQRYELYWIATVAPARETSTRADYAPAHALYRALGYTRHATVPDYHASGDGLAIFGKRL